jgi:hypothetical protein
MTLKNELQNIISGNEQVRFEKISKQPLLTLEQKRKQFQELKKLSSSKSKKQSF